MPEATSLEKGLAVGDKESSDGEMQLLEGCKKYKVRGYLSHREFWGKVDWGLGGKPPDKTSPSNSLALGKAVILCEVLRGRPRFVKGWRQKYFRAMGRPEHPPKGQANQRVKNQ